MSQSAWQWCMRLLVCLCGFVTMVLIPCHEMYKNPGVFKHFKGLEVIRVFVCMCVWVSVCMYVRMYV